MSDSKIGHTRVKEGKVTYKKKSPDELINAIQLGLVNVIGRRETKRDVILKDFQIIESIEFLKSGSLKTPSHSYSDFVFKNYAPDAFIFFRNLFNLDKAAYLNSLCDKALIRLSNPGASGSMFFITKDDNFIVKTVQHKEARFLMKLLPQYYMHLTQHPRTLMPKFYGFHCYSSSGKNIRFVVMNNLQPSHITIHEKYDLKGSTHKRKASQKELQKHCPTLKDLDFRERHKNGIFLRPETYEALKKIISRDCLVISSLNIMDYSFLLAIYNITKSRQQDLLDIDLQDEIMPKVDQSTSKPNFHTVKEILGSSQQLSDLKSVQKSISSKLSNDNSLLRKVVLKRQFDLFSPNRSPSNNVSNTSMHRSISSVEVMKDINCPQPLMPPKNGLNTLASDFHSHSDYHSSYLAQDDQLSNSSSDSNYSKSASIFSWSSSAVSERHLAAQFQPNSQRLLDYYIGGDYDTDYHTDIVPPSRVFTERIKEDLLNTGGISAWNADGEHLMLYFGIIDILQYYRMRKKMEYAFRSIVVDGTTISVNEPEFYAQRFGDFLLKKVFHPLPRETCFEVIYDSKTLDPNSEIIQNLDRFKLTNLNMKDASQNHATYHGENFSKFENTSRVHNSLPRTQLYKSSLDKTRESSLDNLNG